MFYIIYISTYTQKSYINIFIYISIYKYLRNIRIYLQNCTKYTFQCTMFYLIYTYPDIARNGSMEKLPPALNHFKEEIYWIMATPYTKKYRFPFCLLKVQPMPNDLAFRKVQYKVN